MPVKLLPSDADLNHLKYQAKDLFKARTERDPQAAQRIREFHPRFKLTADAAIFDAEFSLADAQLTVARERGFASWPKLKRRVEKPAPADDLSLPFQERIQDPAFRRAVDLLDAGDVEELRAHLRAHPNLVHERVVFEGGNYFQNPSLLEFVAENPNRHGKLPANIVEVAKLILDAGAKNDRATLDQTLGLVCSGRVPRECGVQIPLIDLLCDYGADPNRGMPGAHGEFEAAGALLRRGARVDLPVAAALGRVEDVRRLPDLLRQAFRVATCDTPGPVHLQLRGHHGQVLDCRGLLSEELVIAWRPYIRTCIDLFGPERCMFESNSPVDKGMVGYRTLWNAFKRLASDFTEDEKRSLFAGTARRVYKLDGSRSM